MQRISLRKTLDFEANVNTLINKKHMQEEAMKLNLIKQIIEMHDTGKLKKVDSAVHKIITEEDTLRALAKPMRKQLRIDELKKDQNFQPIDKKKLFKKIEELDAEESIEELLTMI